MNENHITIYPSNWLYNAGVVGFLSCLDREDYLSNSKQNLSYKYKINDDGSILVNRNVFSKIKYDDNYFKNGKVVNLKGNNQYCPNFIDARGNQKEVFKNFVSAFSDKDKTTKINCDLCKEGILVRKELLNGNLDAEQKEKFFSKISKFDMIHNGLLGPSKKFPNSYWNFEAGFKICHLCTFTLLHHHLALTKLSDGSEIFINAPSFKLMYELNKIVREIFGKEEVNATHRREILAMSIVEYARRVQTTLGQWSAMNIEIVVKKDFIDFYTLPYEVVNVISDRKIASLLSDLGEFKILNCVLNKNYNLLPEIVYKLIRANIKGEKLSGYLYREINKNNPQLTSQKILRLYANIIDRRKKCQSNRL